MTTPRGPSLNLMPGMPSRRIAPAEIGPAFHHRRQPRQLADGHVAVEEPEQFAIVELVDQELGGLDRADSAGPQLLDTIVEGGHTTKPLIALGRHPSTPHAAKAALTRDFMKKPIMIVCCTDHDQFSENSSSIAGIADASEKTLLYLGVSAKSYEKKMCCSD